MALVDPRIEALLAAARGQVAVGNAQREQAALLAALGLTRSGLLERASSRVAGQQGAGFAEAPDLMNTTYSLVQGPEGRLFRDARGGLNASAASRGIAGGSGLANQQLLARRELLGQVQDQMRGFDTGQANSLMGQGSGLASLGQGIADIRFEQAREQAAREAQLAAQQGQPDSAARSGQALGAGAAQRYTTVNGVFGRTVVPTSTIALRNRLSLLGLPAAQRAAISRRNQVARAVRR